MAGFSADPIRQPCQLRSAASPLHRQRTGYVFVFLEVFSSEGGIQSYVRACLDAYLKQAQPPPAEVFILRDRATDPNPFQNSVLQFRYFASPWPMVGRLQLALSLGMFLWHRRPERVICGHVLLGRLIYLLCRRLQIPYSAMTYGKEVWRPLGEIDQRVLRGADQVWTISRYSRDLICEVHGLAAHRIRLMPCVVDGNVFRPGPASPGLLKAYGLTGYKVLLTVARLWPEDRYKGVDITLRALPYVLAQVPQVKYLVIGQGDDRPRLEQLALELGVAGQVVFAGFVASEQLAEHYRLADVYVMPSQEGFGIAYLEAMACGVPVLAGDQDGSADPLQDGQLGWRVPYRDPIAVATACLDMLRGSDQRCNGVWLRQQVLTLFGPDVLAQRLSLALSPDDKTIANLNRR